MNSEDFALKRFLFLFIFTPAIRVSEGINKIIVDYVMSKKNVN